ncbi:MULTISPECIES: DUF6476 family protein [unclassified Haematobacter]|uniref:DUF6476 family protein n=1 Tax=unclassified Haematobacter TaxID=2640585 RepID=UPI0025B80066|nr:MULTISPECIES: DUF6476 family protein [unclassified Haematobacter]
MDDAPPPEALPPSLRFLKLLVTVLTATLIIGVLTIVVLLVTRLPRAAAPPPLPETVTLPDGTTPIAFTQGTDWYAVVTAENEILIFDRATGALRQRVEIRP